MGKMGVYVYAPSYKKKGTFLFPLFLGYYFFFGLLNLYPKNDKIQQ
jgi:hypothetical protein